MEDFKQRSDKIWYKFSKIVLASILGLDCKTQTEARVPVERQTVAAAGQEMMVAWRTRVVTVEAKCLE